MVFETGMFSAALSISGERLTTALQDKRSQFDQRFEETFGLKAKVSINQMHWQQCSPRTDGSLSQSSHSLTLLYLTANEST